MLVEAWMLPERQFYLTQLCALLTLFSYFMAPDNSGVISTNTSGLCARWWSGAVLAKKQDFTFIQVGVVCFGCGGPCGAGKIRSYFLFNTYRQTPGNNPHASHCCIQNEYCLILPSSHVWNFISCLYCFPPDLKVCSALISFTCSWSVFTCGLLSYPSLVCSVFVFCFCLSASLSLYHVSSVWALS